MTGGKDRQVQEIDQGGECTFLYSNVDSYLNKRSEFLTLIEEKKPKIIALTEIIAKNQQDVIEKEYEIPGYDIFMNEEPKLGVVIHTIKELNAVEVKFPENNEFEEGVWCSFIDGNKDSVLIGCLYRSPSTTLENTQKMYSLLKSNVIDEYKKVCIVGDFNFPTIRWQGVWSSEFDNDFIEC